MKLRLSLPDAVDMLVIAVEAGLGLDQALQYVSREITEGHPELADELSSSDTKCASQGINAWNRSAIWPCVPENPNCASWWPSSRRAIGLAPVWVKASRTHSDFMRLRRKQDAEERAAKIGVKLVFPIFLFILPSMMLVAAGPALLKIFTDLFPMMQNFGK